MIYREPGQSGIQVSTIAFGAWAIGGFMWGGSDEKQAIEANRHLPVEANQMEDNAQAANIKLSKDEMVSINNHLEKMELDLN